MTTKAGNIKKTGFRDRVTRFLWWAMGKLRPRRRFAHARRIIRRRYAPLEPTPSKGNLFPLPDAPRSGGWTYRDQDWIRVIHRAEHRRLLGEGRALTVIDNEQQPAADVVCGPDGSITADVAATSRQTWVWLYLDPSRHSWADFRWEFTVRRESNFRELQFGFRYVDFYNRYRFRHEAGHLHFDIAVNGVFRNSICQVPFHMNLGQEYRFAIEARDHRFVLKVDGVVMLDEIDRERLFPRGSIAIIFWESDGKTAVKSRVADITVVET